MLSPSPARFAPILLLFAAVCMPATRNGLVIPLVSAPNWQLQSSTDVPLDALKNYGDHIQVDQELGVRAGAERTYRLRNLRANAIFEKAADPSSAFSLFTLYQQPGMNAEPGVELAMVGADQAVMARGRYFIRVLRPAGQAISTAEFRSLLVDIGGAHISPENAQSLPPGLPRHGLVPGSEKYLLGEAAARVVLPRFPVDLIGFQSGAEAKLGTYASRGERLKLLEIDYPTPQLAALQFKKLAQAVHLNAPRTSEAIYGRQQGAYGFLVLNAGSASAAMRLLGQFKVSESLTWSPKYKKDSTAYELVLLLMANGELVLIILGLAIPCGILIYVTKRLVAKHFPDSPLSGINGDDMIHLNLG